MTVHGEGGEGPHTEDSQLTPKEPIQKDTNPIDPEKGPGSVSVNARDRRAVPLTNITSSHQAHLLYPFMTHRNSPLSPHSTNVRQTCKETYPDNSELHFAEDKPPLSRHTLSSSFPAPVVDSTCTDPAVYTYHSEKMAQYEPLANDIAMTPRRAIVFATGTLRRLPAAVLRCFKTLALDGFEIAVAVLQRISAIGSVGIVKEVLALPISN